jgi:hypothetical protein
MSFSDIFPTGFLKTRGCKKSDGIMDINAKNTMVHHGTL